MAKKVRFNLYQNRNTTCYIYAVIRYQNRKLAYSTGISIEAPHWDKYSQRTTKGNPYWKAHNNRLNEIEAQTVLLLNRVDGNSLSIAEVRKEFLAILGKKVEEKSKLLSFSSYYSSTAFNKHKPSNMARVALQHFGEYMVRDIASSPTFSDVNYSVLVGFSNYLSQELELRPNSVCCYVNAVKSMLKEASRRGYITDLSYQSWSSISYVNDKVYLTPEEIELLEGYRPRHRWVDIFLFQCYTGIRISDAIRLDFAQLSGKQYLELFTQKTKSAVKVPLSKKAQDIVNRLKGKRFKKYPNACTTVIRRVAMRVGITNEVTIVEDGIIKKYPKWQLIGSHTARRSFACNAYNAGIPIYSIMRLLGHSNIHTTQRYLKLSANDIADSVVSNSFFK